MAALIALLADAKHGRILAAHALERLAVRGDAAAVAGVDALLAHALPAVRTTALRVLGKIAEHGTAVAVASVTARLADSHAEVRTTALRVLGKLAKLGDAAVVTALTARLADSSKVIRRGALEWLKAHLKDSEGVDQQAAVAAVARVADDACVRQALKKLEKDKDSSVRAAARQVLNR